MEKTYNDAIGFNNTLAGMARERWPFGISLAKDIKIMDKLIIAYNELREAVVNKYAKRNEDGEILGIWRDLPAKEGEEPKKERVVKPTRIDETEWTDKAAFEKELTELNAQKVDFVLSPVDVNTVYYNQHANKEMTILQYIDANMEPSLVLYLSDFEFFKNLNLEPAAKA